MRAATLLFAVALISCRPGANVPKDPPLDFASLPGPTTFGSEATLLARWAGPLRTRWDQGEPGEFAGVDGVMIRYVIHRSVASRGAVVIVPGRTEPTIKYAEVIDDLLSNGYSTYALDLRGQGASDRMLPDRDRGYVVFFQDYVDDLEHFLRTVVLPEESKNVFILAHSTGGAIAALLVDEHQELVTAMAMSAPMFELVTGSYPAPVAFTLASTLCSGTDATGYAQGSDYVEGDFGTNSVTRSQARFDWKLLQMRDAPQLRLGGATFRWLCEALAGSSRAQALGRYSPVPTLIFQAEADTVVKLPAQGRYCGDAPRCQLSLMPDSQHEIFQERDSIRDLALSQALKFFDARRNP